MSYIEKFTKFFEKKDGEKSKKLLSRDKLIIALLIGVVLIVAGSSMFSGGGGTGNQTATQTDTSVKGAGTSSGEAGNSINVKDIEGIISKIDGAGKVSVMITYESGVEKVPGTDKSVSDTDTTEKDAQGGDREITDSKEDTKVVYEGDNKNVFISKEIQPAIKGVLIVASGAGDAQVSANIANAAKVLFNLPIHKIQVIEGNKQ